MITISEHKKEIIYLLLPLVLLLLVFPTVLFPDNTLITGTSDTQLIINTELSVANNPVALWNNQWLTGIPEYANPLSDRFYPFFYPLFVLTQDPYILNFIVLIHLYIAYLCFFKLSGVMTKSSELRMVSSLLFIFSGVLLSRVYAGHILIIFALAWIPLLYYAFFKIVWDNEVTVKNVLLIAASILLVFFTGAVYYLFYSCLILFVFFLYYLIKREFSRGALYAVSGAFILAGLLASIRFIPVLLISDSLNRIDPINPLGDGGSLESIFGAIVFGTPIDKVFPFWESSIFIGMFIVLLVILGLVFERERKSVPAFLAIVVAFVWAEGGNTLFSFIHLLPVVMNFRCAGRVFGTLAPILILFAISGFELVKEYLNSGKPIIPAQNQKRNVLYGLGILILIQFMAAPFQTPFSFEAIISTLFIVAFICLLYFDKLSNQNLIYILIASILVNVAMIAAYTVNPVTISIGLKSLVILAIIGGAIFYFNRDWFSPPSVNKTGVWILLLLSVGVVMVGNISYLQNSSPAFVNSTAPDIIKTMTDNNVDGHQLWVLETGWAYQHLDYTYWFLKNGIHPVHAYYGYYMKTTIAPLFNIGNTTYFTSDYIVDNKYLETGQQSLPEVTYTVNNISVYKPANVLPSVFVIREDQLVPVKIEKFTPDEIIASGTFFKKGDIVGIKTAYYPGWKADGVDMKNIGNMPFVKLTSDTKLITFRYDPFDLKVGAFFTVVGLFALFIIVIRRHEIDAYLLAASPVQEVVEEDPVAKKKSKKKRRY